MTLSQFTKCGFLATALLVPTLHWASQHTTATRPDATILAPGDTAKADSTARKDSAATDTAKKKKPDSYEKVIKDGGSVNEGLFTVRHIKDDWYWEVPDSVLGRHLLAVTRFTAVPQGFKKFSGEEVNRSTIYLEQHGDKQILVREYVQSIFAPEDDRINQTLKASTVDPIVYKLDVIGRNPKTKAQLVKVTKFLQTDNKLTGFTNADKASVQLGAVQTDRSFLDTIKTYPINVEVAATRTYAFTQGSEKLTLPAARVGSATISLNTSIVLLPKKPMQMRLADERVGYFQNKITRMADDIQGTEHDAIVMRYRLEPADPAAYKAGRLSKPKKQIVYYIDPATPKQWVPYLKAGVDDWNKAFEKAGFKDAIVAKEWPNDPTMSMEDARFSMIRYLPAEIENAYGPRIVDPRSGEIIEAHVCWYHNVMNLVKKWYITQCGPLDKSVLKMKGLRDMDPKLLGELIRFVSSHEVGHSLGLRHNMIASSSTPVEKLRDKAWVEAHGHTASIMDYARFNYVAQPEDGIGHKGLFPRINDYDIWAITWGYQWRPEFKDPYKEKATLRSEVTKRLTANQRLRYIGDEGRAQDPRSQTEDLGDNSMKASDYGVKNLKRVVDHLEQWGQQPDGQYEDLNYLFTNTRQQFMRYINHVQRNIGGVMKNNWPAARGVEYVARDRQREAIEWMGRQVFTAPLWLYPDRICQRLGTDAYDEIRLRQNNVLSYLLAPTTVYNMYQQQSDTGYDVEEYLNDVAQQVWTPLNASTATDNKLRRLLQRSYLSLVDKVLNPAEADFKGATATALRSDIALYMAQHLSQLEESAKKLSTNASGIDREHFNRMLSQIRKIRNNYEKETAD